MSSAADAESDTGKGARSCAVLLVHALTADVVEDILADLEQRRGWRAARSAVIVCPLEGGESSVSELPAGFRAVSDGEQLAPGGRYLVSPHQRAWFEGSR